MVGFTVAKFMVVTVVAGFMVVTVVAGFSGYRFLRAIPNTENTFPTIFL